MIVTAHHPLMVAMRRGGESDDESRTARAVAEELEAALAGTQDLAALDDATATARCTRAMRACVAAWTYVSAGGPARPLVRYLEREQMACYQRACARLGPLQDVVRPLGYVP